MFDFGFIGCGNMGGTLLGVVAKNNPELKIAAADAFPGKAETFAGKYPNVTVSTAKEIAGGSRYVVIGVKPQMLEALFEELRPAFAFENGMTLISMCAATSTERIKELAGFDAKIIRIMPNTPALVGEGAILWCANALAGEEQKKEFVSVFAPAGLLEEMPESKIDAGSAVSGSGPAFVYMFIEAMADGGVRAGLPRDTAMRLAAATVKGAAEMVLETGIHPGELKDNVCSPAGTTIEGVIALEKATFRGAVTDAVVKTYEKNLNLK